MTLLTSKFTFPGYYPYGGSLKPFCLNHTKSKKSGSASVSEVVAYFLKFQYLTNMYIRIRRNLKKSNQNKTVGNNDELYQDYLRSENLVVAESSKTDPVQSEDNNDMNLNNNTITQNNSDLTEEEEDYCTYLEKAIFGSPIGMENVNRENLIVKRNNMGLISKVVSDENKKRSTDEIIKHNLQKVHFYEQNPGCASLEDIFVSHFFISLFTSNWRVYYRYRFVFEAIH